MGIKWDENNIPETTGVAWKRSWRQTIETALGDYPHIVAHIEEVTRYSNGQVLHAPVCDLIIRMDRLCPADLVKAQTVQTLLTELIGDALVRYQNGEIDEDI